MPFVYTKDITKCINNYVFWYSPTMVKFTLTKAGRSGASIDVPINAELVSTAEAGPFAWNVFRTNGSSLSHLKLRPGMVVKRNVDPIITDIELAVTAAYAERGFAVPSTRRIDDTTLEMERVDGLTLAEEFFYDCLGNPARVADRLVDTYHLARAMNLELSNILSHGQKEYLLDRQRQKLLNEGVSIEDAARRPLSARVDARARKLTGVSVDPIIFETLTALEEVLRPLTQKYAAWSLESNGNNFIGETRIDMNGIYYGVDDDSFLLDTPYMLSDTFWIRRRDEPHLSEYQWMENMKGSLILSFALQKREVPVERRELFQGSRIFRNILQLFYAYNNAVAVKSKRETLDLLGEAKLYQHLNEMFAHYEMQDTGLNSILLHHRNDNSPAGQSLRSTAQSYSAALENMMKQMCAVLLPDQRKLKEYAASFRSIQENYRELKQNCPRDI